MQRRSGLPLSRSTRSKRHHLPIPHQHHLKLRLRQALPAHHLFRFVDIEIILEMRKFNPAPPSRSMVPTAGHPAVPLGSRWELLTASFEESTARTMPVTIRATRRGARPYSLS